MSLRVLRPGLLTTIQDLGRPGLQRFGVPVGGAMDSLALQIANVLVGNDEGAAGLEITLLGPSLEFEEETLLAICGGDLSPRVGDVPVPAGRPVLIPAGRTLTFDSARTGCRAYLAVAGGIDVPRVLGSRATYLLASIGGLEGRALQTGDVLQVGHPSELAPRIAEGLRAENDSPSVATVNWRAGILPDLSGEAVLRVLPGSELEWLSPDSRRQFFSQPLTVTPQSDRMGFRLAGAPLSLTRSGEVISAAVCPGTIQLPPQGAPILLMADCATTGGYPKLAHVVAADLPRAAQLKPGDRLILREISLAEAHNLYSEQERSLRRLKAGIALRFRTEREIASPVDSKSQAPSIKSQRSNKFQ